MGRKGGVSGVDRERGKVGVRFKTTLFDPRKEENFVIESVGGSWHSAGRKGGGFGG